MELRFSILNEVVDKYFEDEQDDPNRVQYTFQKLRDVHLEPDFQTKANTYSTINWSDIPAGNDLNVRMSGLIWPEASQRIANSAYLTRERFGKGQIILFAGEPNFRGASLGTNRLWLNAIVYGSGLGTSTLIRQ